MLVFAVSGMGAIGIAGIAAAIALVVFMVLSQAEERSVVRASLRQLEDYEIETVRDRELLNPLRERAILPTVKTLTSIGRRFTPVGYVEGVRKKFIYAGNASPDALDKFLALRVITVIVAPILGLLVLFSPSLEGTAKLAATGFALALPILGPDAILNRKVEERQYQIRTKLPDILDLLVISVEAGLGFEQALDRTVAAVPGPLTEEFSRMLGEVRAGATRADALRAIEDRTNAPELRSFILAILQADTFGVSIGRVLRAQADEMRVKRRQLAQERAQKAPVKMMVPMVFCIFPSLFVVVLGPAMINLVENFRTV